MMSKWLWPNILLNMPVVTFVDNDAARFGSIRGSSSSADSSAITAISADLDAGLGIHQWVARVPSLSNIADAPSRLDFSCLLALGAHRYHACGPGGARLDAEWNAISCAITDRVGNNAQ